MGTAALIDGTLVDTASERWRAECEARTLLNMPLHQRKRVLNLVEQKRGRQAADQLRGDVMTLWVARQAAMLANMRPAEREARLRVLERDNGPAVAERIRGRMASNDNQPEKGR